MKKSVCFSLPILVLILGAAAPAPQRGPIAAKISVTTRLDKTAIWVGDTLTYTIRLIHAREIEFILDDLKKENLPLAPFVVRSLDIHQGEWAGEKRLLEIQLLLSSYETGKNELTIPSFNLFYFKRLYGSEKKESAAEAIRIPASRVSLRSTLSSGKNSPREFKPIPSMDLTRALITLLLGTAGMIFLALRGLRWSWLALQSDRPRKRRMRQRQRERSARESLGRIKAMKRDGQADLARFYSEIAQLLRQYVNRWLDIQAEGLTPDEIETALTKANVNGTVAQEIKAVLEQCERVCYGNDSLRLAADRSEEVLQAVERVVGRH